MVDIVLLLTARGHRGPLSAVSRHGRAPSRHRAGGSWAPFLGRDGPLSPLQALKAMRRELAGAAAAGAPWQRVFDAARPDVAGVWRGWTLPQRSQFLRRLRTQWDVHRHRMAPRIAAALDRELDSGRLRIQAGRIRQLAAADDGVHARVKLRGGEEQTLGPFARVVNCTGPRSDFGRMETPLIGQLRRLSLIRPDALRLGLDTDRCALIDAAGRASSWLYAVGPVTRPALWEVTAVPEINAQIDSLVAGLTGEVPAAARADALHLAFADMGAGI